MNYRLFLAWLFILMAIGLTFFPWWGSIPEKYSHGVLIAWVWLEDIHLHKSDLISVVNTLWNGTLAVTASDYWYAYELWYEKFGYIFFFKIPKQCQESVWGLKELAHIKNNTNSFISQYPRCKNIPLSSIFVWPWFDGTNSFWQKIGDEIFSGSTVWKVDTSRRHDFSATPNTLISKSNNWESISFDSGIRIYYDLEKKGEKNMLVIQWMTVYKQDDTDESSNPRITTD